ncbi:hypothetical protein [Altererythrobacter sp.]|uniref:hypothetical protein n=1 Tax=Altererythrobacter sp. TaxID=1872480 RepID=UPI001B025AEE|nr:hypothetical protein [Altererythrobacter sp.]MBO6610374.1 hypothetical protein [Altererythrobacter sp.]MBO6642644.1 hypothetical protein [Altererythrobacter sp.]MBO6708848.1 hypothetical protein [Altererythrobacter sp.]
MFEPTMIIAAASLVGLCIVAFALLKAWHSWLALKQRELENSSGEIEGGVGNSAARIEIADLKERIKKLEAIASGVDL